MSDLEDIRALASEDAAKTALRKALRMLDDERTKREELYRAIYDAARDAAATIDIPAVPKPPKDRRTVDPEAAILLLADWQYGKVTPDYDSEV